MRTPPQPLKVIVAIAIGAVIVTLHGAAFKKVTRSRSARDFATYYYATQAALNQTDPYDKAELGQLARQDRTRRAVHPFFYPPPFLLGTVWMAPLSLNAAAIFWFWLQELMLVGTLVVLRKWVGAPLLLLAGVAALHTPIHDNLTMGQVNLTIGFIAVVGLWRGAGTWVGAAAMAKMSPALYLAAWGARGQMRPIVIAGLSAIALSVLALPVVGIEHQLRFYTDVLPGFTSGNYNGLTVPITLPANHSVPDLFNQLWPGPDNHHLSEAAAGASRLTSLVLLLGVAWVARQARDNIGLACAFGAMTVLLLITPIYTYEHHLSLLVLPIVASGAALSAGRLAPGWWVPWGVGVALSAAPLSWLRSAKRAAPALEWVVQESKFVALVTILVVCAAGALAAPPTEPST